MGPPRGRGGGAPLLAAVAARGTDAGAVLAAGAGAAAAILAGVPLAGVAAVGALAWAARLALTAPRRPRAERIDPSALAEPWRHMVRDALEARARFGRTVAQARPGPLRDRLAELGDRLDHGVRQCWRVAGQGAALETALGTMDRAAAERELADLAREARSAGAGERESLERAARAVRSQIESAERVERVARDARTRLRVLNAQLDEAVARAVELSLTAGDSAAVRPLSEDVESLVGELESLRAALEETSGAPGPAGA